MVIEVEVDTLEQLDAVLPARPDIVLLDNMGPAQLREAVARRNAFDRAIELEASGGIDLSTVRQIAETGVERISIGALSHSAAALDFGLDWDCIRAATDGRDSCETASGRGWLLSEHHAGMWRQRRCPVASLVANWQRGTVRSRTVRPFSVDWPAVQPIVLLHLRLGEGRGRGAAGKLGI